MSERKIECFGDNLCCGEVCEALDYLKNVDFKGNDGYFGNYWYKFPAVALRLLNTNIHNVSQRGLALLDGTGYCFPFYFHGL